MPPAAATHPADAQHRMQAPEQGKWHVPASALINRRPHTLGSTVTIVANPGNATTSDDGTSPSRGGRPSGQPGQAEPHLKHQPPQARP